MRRLWMSRSLRITTVDLIVRGEGEQPCSKSPETLGEPSKLHDIKGITFKENN